MNVIGKTSSSGESASHAWQSSSLEIDEHFDREAALMAHREIRDCRHMKLGRRGYRNVSRRNGSAHDLFQFFSLSGTIASATCSK